MLKLDIMTESELGQIFGTLDSLIPLHEGEPSLFAVHTFKTKNSFFFPLTSIKTAEEENVKLMNLRNVCSKLVRKN